MLEVGEGVRVEQVLRVVRAGCLPGPGREVADAAPDVAAEPRQQAGGRRDQRDEVRAWPGRDSALRCDGLHRRIIVVGELATPRRHRCHGKPGLAGGHGSGAEQRRLELGSGRHERLGRDAGRCAVHSKRGQVSAERGAGGSDVRSGYAASRKASSRFCATRSVSADRRRLRCAPGRWPRPAARRRCGRARAARGPGPVGSFARPIADRGRRPGAVKRRMYWSTAVARQCSRTHRRARPRRTHPKPRSHSCPRQASNQSTTKTSTP